MNKNGTIVNGNDEIRGVTFSSDGLRYGFIARKRNKYVAVIDGEESKEYDYVKNLTFSPDGSRYGFIAEEGGIEIVIVDGEKVGGGRITSKLFFNNQDYAFVRRNNGKYVVELNGDDIGEYQNVWGIVLTNDYIAFYYEVDLPPCAGWRERAWLGWGREVILLRSKR